MLHCFDLLAFFIEVLPCGLVTDELLACDRMLSFTEAVELLFTNLSFEAPFVGQSSVPLASYPFALRVVIRTRVAELFRMVGACLSGAQRLGNCQHVGYSKNRWCLCSLRFNSLSRICFTSCGE